MPQAKDLVAQLLQKDPAKRIKMKDVFVHPWVRAQRHKQAISAADHECMLNIFKSLRHFSTLKIADFQLGVLVFLINFIVEYENEDVYIRCFHLIDSEGDGVVTEKELAEALIEY
jgi:serine/threonine protein kinase